MNETELLGTVNARKLEHMTAGRRFLRLLFFAAESGTVASWYILTGGLDLEIYYRGLLSDPFSWLEPFAYISFFTVPVVSFCLRRSDRRLANIGFATFAGILIFFAVFRLF